MLKIAKREGDVVRSRRLPKRLVMRNRIPRIGNLIVMQGLDGSDVRVRVEAIDLHAMCIVGRIAPGGRSTEEGERA